MTQTRAQARRGWLLAYTGLTFVAFTATVGWARPWNSVAHVALRKSEPAANDTLSKAPTSIRLDFTEAVEVRLARLTVVGADSAEVALTSVRPADSTDKSIVADVVPALSSGTYHVRWSVTSRDSHTIRGAYDFTVLIAATDTVPPVRAPADSGAASPAPEEPGPGGSFDVRSPAYVAVRWITYLGMLGVVGALVFQAMVLPTIARGYVGGDGAAARVVGRASRAARVGGISAALLLVGAGGLRLMAQLRAVAGDGGAEAGMFSALIGGTAWGWGWTGQMVAAFLALGIVARRGDVETVGRTPAMSIVGLLAVLILGVSAAISGHPAAATPVFVAVGADAAHVIAAGGWIGALAYVVFAGLPATADVDADARPQLARELVTAFSNIALVCVAIIVASGVVAAWLQMRSVSALWTTPYGRVLMLKLGIVALVGGAGAYNWRVATPRILLLAGGISRIRAVMLAELLLAVLVLGATAVLVATPPPLDAMNLP